MTSVVDTSVKHFHSAMVGAPILNGQVGSLIALLNACLVDGFDVKAGTLLVVASGVATLSFAGTHSAVVDGVVLVSGSSIAALNGEQKITAIGSGFVQFATAAADGAATGSISFKMAPAGWMQPFVGTNLATYKSADPASTGMTLRVDDTGTYQSGVVGYESMTDINTGTGPFPTAAMVTGGGLWAKSWTANTTANPWTLVCDGRAFYLNIAASYASRPESNYVGHISRGFGDMLALRPGGDPYVCVLNCHTNTTVVPAAAAMAGSFSTSGISPSNSFLPREYTGLGSGVRYACIPFTGNGVSGLDTRLGSFPSPVDGGLRLSAKFLTYASSGSAAPPRAHVPGLFHVPQDQVFDSFKTLDTVMGTGPLVGRKLLAVAVTDVTNANTSGTIGILFFDITGPWR